MRYSILIYKDLRSAVKWLVYFLNCLIHFTPAVEFTGEDLPDPENTIRYGLEASTVFGISVPLNQIADSVSIDAVSGVIKLAGYNGDQQNTYAKDLRLRVIASIPLNLEASQIAGEKLVFGRFASPYFFPVMKENDCNHATEGRFFFIIVITLFKRCACRYTYKRST